jgi:hypothetical protein
MHYRNGREAKNGDKVIQLNSEGKVTGVGVLHNAKSDGGEHCNGNIAPTIFPGVQGACLCDCLHEDDLAAVLAEKALEKRPDGK